MSPGPRGSPWRRCRTSSTGAPARLEERRRGAGGRGHLGYRPNAIARSLRARRTASWGWSSRTAPIPTSPLSHAIEEAATERGYQVIIANAAERPEREAGHIEALLRLQVDGLFWIPADLRRRVVRRRPGGGVSRLAGRRCRP